MFNWWPFKKASPAPVAAPKPTPTPPVVPPPTPVAIPVKQEPLPAIPPVVPMRDIYWVYRPLFDLLGKSEGTDKGRGYNETLAFGAYTGGPVNLEVMDLMEIDALQTRMLAHPKNKWNSSAIGRYQIVRTTLRKIKKAMGLSNHIKFDRKTQDHMCLYLLNGRGLGRYLEGALKEDAFITNLAKEWASIPTPSGLGYYDNQHRTPVTPDQVRKVLAEVRARAKA